MRSASQGIRRWIATGFAIGLFIGVAAGVLAMPVVRFTLAEYYEDEYGRLMFRCDQAMRSHFIARTRVGTDPSQTNADLLAEAEVGIIVCHDYDILRKRLLRLGLTEADLAAMGLFAIEAHAPDIRRLVETHEIRYN